MLLKEIMTPELTVIGGDATEQQAAETMREHDIGVLPVCENQTLIGIVTDRDLAIRGMAQGHDPRTTPVREVMTTDLVICYDDQPVSEAERLMQERKVRRIAVLNREQHLAGMLSLGDLALRENERCGVERTLEQVSEPAA